MDDSKIYNHLTKRNSLGMTEQVYSHLLDKLNEVNAESELTPHRRIYTRLEYFEPSLDLSLRKSEFSDERKIVVATRNISRGGLSVLHSNYIHPNTSVIANLHRINNDPLPVPGRVIRCNHLGGVVHEIGIQFDSEIIVQEFVLPDINESIQSLESVSPTQLKGSVCFIGDDEEITPKIRQFLQRTNITFGFIKTAQKAYGANLSKMDLLFVTLDHDEIHGHDFARAMRDRGFRKPIILSGHADSESEKRHIKLSTADMFLPTPFDQSSFLCALGEFLLADWPDEILESIRSRIDHADADTLRSELTELGTMLDFQLQLGDAVEIYITCTKIRSIAVIIGHKPLLDLTQAVCDTIAQTGDIERFKVELNQIHLMCKDANKAA